MGETIGPSRGPANGNVAPWWIHYRLPPLAATHDRAVGWVVQLAAFRGR